MIIGWQFLEQIPGLPADLLYLRQSAVSYIMKINCYLSFKEKNFLYSAGVMNLADFIYICDI